MVTPYAMINLRERGTFLVEPTPVYEGMIVSMNSRTRRHRRINITKETNMRSSTADNFENLTPPKKLTLEECLEFAREDECVGDPEGGSYPQGHPGFQRACRGCHVPATNTRRSYFPEWL